MTTSIFGIGLSGLAAAQAGLLTAGHNIANVNTPGYNRQQALFAARPGVFSGSGYMGMGVDVTTVQRIYSTFAAQRTLQSQASSTAIDARANAYEMQGDYRRAEQDFRALLAQDPGDMRTLSKLGDMFVNWEKNWDKGWAVADQLIREQPQNPYGLLLRAGIQEQQPRGGLDATVQQLQARFGKDPNMAKIIVRMRAAVALRKHTGIDGKPAAP